MRTSTIVIPDAAATKLAELARRHFRAPRHEAAALLVEAIERVTRARHAAGRGRGPATGTAERQT